MIDLCKCKPGDYLITRSGLIYTYSHYRGKFDPVYPHVVVSNTRGLYDSFTNDGRYCTSLRLTERDIVKIIPQESPNIYFTLYEHKKRSMLV